MQFNFSLLAPELHFAIAHEHGMADWKFPKVELMLPYKEVIQHGSISSSLIILMHRRP